MKKWNKKQNRLIGWIAVVVLLGVGSLITIYGKYVTTSVVPGFRNPAGNLSSGTCNTLTTIQRVSLEARRAALNADLRDLYNELEGLRRLLEDARELYDQLDPTDQATRDRLTTLIRYYEDRIPELSERVPGIRIQISTINQELQTGCRLPAPGIGPLVIPATIPSGLPIHLTDDD